MDERMNGLIGLSNWKVERSLTNPNRRVKSAQTLNLLRRLTCNGGKEVDLKCGSLTNLLTHRGVIDYPSQMWRNCKMALLSFFQNQAVHQKGVSLANRAASRRSTAQSIKARPNDKHYRINMSHRLPSLWRNQNLCVKQCFRRLWWQLLS